MFFFNKVINFFLNSYQSNNKFRNSLFSYLKLFFERDTKKNISYTNLGNVFKNSKWTNLRNQNIKNNFLREFILFIFLFFAVYLLDTSNFKNALMQFYVLHIQSLYFFVVDSYLLFCMGLTYVFFPHLFKGSIITLKNDNLVSKPTTKRFKLKKRKAFKSNTADYTLLASLYKADLELSNSKLDTVLNKDLAKNRFHAPNLNNNFSLTNPNIKDFNNLTSLNLGSLNSLTNNPYFMNLSTNYVNDLNLMKNDRWLLKNSLLSEDFVRNTHNFTEAKKLINSNTLSSKVSNSNVWVSTNLHDSDFFKKLTSTNSTNLENVFFKNSDLSSTLNYNFFEDSRLFLFKKYYFTGQTGFNTLVFDDKYNDLNQLSSSNLNHFDILLSLSNISINHNLSSLYLNNINSLEFTSLLNKEAVNSNVFNNTPVLLTTANLLFLNNVYTNNKTTWYSYF